MPGFYLFCLERPWLPFLLWSFIKVPFWVQIIIPLYDAKLFSLFPSFNLPLCKFTFSPEIILVCYKLAPFSLLPFFLLPLCKLSSSLKMIRPLDHICPFAFMPGFNLSVLHLTLCVKIVFSAHNLNPFSSNPFGFFFLCKLSFYLEVIRPLHNFCAFSMCCKLFSGRLNCSLLYFQVVFMPNYFTFFHPGHMTEYLFLQNLLLASNFLLVYLFVPLCLVS